MPPKFPKFVGYWTGPYARGLQSKDYEGLDERVVEVIKRSSLLDSHLLDPKTLVDHNWDTDVRAAVINHLKNGRKNHGWLGHSKCRFCDCDNGSWDMTDGTYVWPEGLVHYIIEHGVRLDEEFVSHVMKRKK